MRFHRILTGAMLGAGMLLAGPSAPAALAQAGPPDFAHRDDPHSERYSFDGASTDRPMLVLYPRFNDVPYPEGQDAAFWADRFFGGFPSVSDYFEENSFGDLVLSPADETDASNGGSANDGVVSISIDEDKGDFLEMGRSAEAKALLEEADPFVDFSDFDRNDDNRISNFELVLNRLDTDPDETNGCGKTTGVDTAVLDGVAMDVQIANGGTDTNLITIIHETSHVALDTDDFYGYGVGSFDVMGPTCNGDPLNLRRMTAWHLYHLGWAEPTVPTRDGYLRLSELGVAGRHVILHDPDAGADRYYIVENRMREPGTYDEEASDSGLVIWEVNESFYDEDSEIERPIELKRPDGSVPRKCDETCYGGSRKDAWDPSDGETPERTFAPTSGPKVAVRAIPAASDAMRVFFDVPGPGVLVDPSDERGRPLRIDVTPDEFNKIRVPVMNTGDVWSDFRFELFGVPAGWSAGIDDEPIGDHAKGAAQMPLRPDANAPTGVRTIGVAGKDLADPSVRSDALFEVNVVLDRTFLAYRGLESAATGAPAGFAVRVVNPDDEGIPPVEGATVQLRLAGAGGVVTASAVTDANGIAEASPTLDVPPGAYQLTASVARTGKHAPGTVAVDYTVERRPAVLAWAGDTEGEYSDPTVAGATLTDELTGSPLAGRAVDLAIGDQSSPVVTGTDGNASTTIVLDQASDLTAGKAWFAGDETYLPAEATVGYQVRKETLSLAYTGDRSSMAPAVPRLAAHATQEADGSPGDLSLARARFDLVPTLTAAPFTFIAPVSGTGDAATPATSVPVDLWRATAKVLPSNPYWTGAPAGPVDVAVMDGARTIGGNGRGPDSSSMQTRLSLGQVRFDGAWRNDSRLESTTGEFRGEDYDWVVVVGNRGLAQVRGTLDGSIPATMRYLVVDGGSPGSADRFSATLREAGGAALYASGDVTPRSGNLRIG